MLCHAAELRAMFLRYFAPLRQLPLRFVVSHTVTYARYHAAVDIFAADIFTPYAIILLFQAALHMRGARYMLAMLTLHYASHDVSRTAAR